MIRFLIHCQSWLIEYLSECPGEVCLKPDCSVKGSDNVGDGDTEQVLFKFHLAHSLGYRILNNT